MKAMLLFTMVLLVLASPAQAQNTNGDDEQRIEGILNLAARNLKVTLKTGSDELKESAIQVVKELKQEYPNAELTSTVIPLMTILRNHKDKNLRILAAMTLQVIGDDRGFLAIQEASRFDEDSIVRHICTSIDVGRR